MVSFERSGRPRQFIVMNENSRCSILFHLLVPGGKWLTRIASPCRVPLESIQKRIQESGYLNALSSCYAATATAAPRCSARYSAGVFQPSA